MAIPVTCACGQTYRVGDALAGKRVRCKQCNAVLAVPASSPARPSPAPSASAAAAISKPLPRGPAPQPLQPPTPGPPPKPTRPSPSSSPSPSPSPSAPAAAAIPKPAPRGPVPGPLRPPTPGPPPKPKRADPVPPVLVEAEIVAEAAEEKKPRRKKKRKRSRAAGASEYGDTLEGRLRQRAEEESDAHPWRVLGFFGFALLMAGLALYFYWDLSRFEAEGGVRRLNRIVWLAYQIGGVWGPVLLFGALSAASAVLGVLNLIGVRVAIDLSDD